LTSFAGFPSDLRHVKGLKLTGNALTSLLDIPKLYEIMGLRLAHNQISSLHGLPESLPNLYGLYLSHNPITSLAGISQHLPKLSTLILDQIYSSAAGHGLLNLEYFPSPCPNMRTLSILGNTLEYFRGLPSNLPTLGEFQFSPRNQTTLRSLSYLSKPNLRELVIWLHNRHSLDALTIKAQRFFGPVYAADETLLPTEERMKFPALYSKHWDTNSVPNMWVQDFAEATFQRLYDYYRKTPDDLAQQYMTAPSSLTPTEHERLIHETDGPIYNYLSQKLSTTDPIFEAFRVQREDLVYVASSILR
jgi:hypothetical protein